MSASVDEFRFRDLHPNVRLGTASDRYAGWIGQIYTEERYEGRIKRRTRRLGKGSFVEEVLPVDSVAEYFEHFSVLEIDYTFYRPLIEEDGTPTANHHVLRQYREHLRDGDRLILKVPQAVFAQKVRGRSGYVPNDSYLDPDLFTRRFYEPATELLGPCLAGMIFEQEYQRKEDRRPVEEMAAGLDAFFRAIPRDTRYHVELRTEHYLAPAVFDVLERHGVGQILSHWTWLPPLTAQFERAGARFLNAGGECVIRLMTPLGVRYEDAYAKAHPFCSLVGGLFQERMVTETVSVLGRGIAEGQRMNLIINNRAGGNAPLIAQRVAKGLIEAVSGDNGPKRLG